MDTFSLILRIVFGTYWFFCFIVWLIYRWLLRKDRYFASFSREAWQEHKKSRSDRIALRFMNSSLFNCLIGEAKYVVVVGGILVGGGFLMLLFAASQTPA